MEFRPHQRNPIDINFKFNNIKLELVDKYPLLGISIDSNTNWKEHINKVAIKLSRFSYALKELKKLTNLESAKSAYYAYAHSWLTYGILLWGNSTEVIKLFRLQKRCVRVLGNLSVMDSCKPFFEIFNILTLPSLYIFAICEFVRKHPDFFPYHQRPQNLRRQNKLAQPTCNYEMFRSGPLSMCVKIYNSLPSKITDEKGLLKFKLILKKYLKEKCFYSLQEFLDDF